MGLNQEDDSQATGACLSLQVFSWVGGPLGELEGNRENLPENESAFVYHGQ